MDADPELLDLFFSETAANAAAARRILSSDRAAPSERAVVARAFHTLAGTAGLVGHPAWGRVAAAAERLARRWLSTGDAPPGVVDLLRETLYAVGAFAAERAGAPPAALCERLQKTVGSS